MPNDGTRIYSQVIDGKEYGVDEQNDIYKVLGIGAYEGYYDIVWACINRHGKICRYSAMKPYRFGTYENITRDIAKANNFGMTPVLLLSQQTGANRLDSTPWGQWQPPRVDVDYSRTGDFDGYNKGATPHIKALRIHTSKNATDTTPILGSTGGNSNLEGKLIGEIEFSLPYGGTTWLDKDYIWLEDFKYNGMAINAWRLTLVFGAFVQDSFETAWVVQGPRVDEMRDGLFTIEMVTTDNAAILNGVVEQGYGHSLTVLCVAPEIAGATRGIVNEIPTHMLSLNMWGNDFRQIIYNENYAQPSLPEPERYINIEGTCTPSRYMFAEASYSFRNDEKRLYINIDSNVRVDVSEDSDGGNLTDTGYLLGQFIFTDINNGYRDIFVENVPISSFKFVNKKTDIYGEYSIPYSDITRLAGLDSGKYFVRLFLTIKSEWYNVATRTMFRLSTVNDNADAEMASFNFSNPEGACVGTFDGYSDQRQINF